MMAAPNLYATAHQPLFADLAPALRTAQMDLLYVTDRVPHRDPSGALTYGYERSSSAAWGSAVVEVGDEMSWEELVAYSTEPSGPFSHPTLRLTSIHELGRFPATPYPVRVSALGAVAPTPEVRAKQAEATARIREELRRRLALTPRKEVFLFVHGVANSFERALRDAGEGWHFLGREGVAIVYTWPAGRRSLNFYAYDRESGEFTVFHLKQLFELLAATPEVEKIHVVAHSRGTDVATTALRELVIAARAAGLDPREKLKVEHVALIAADLDIEVVTQRIVAEALGAAVGRVTLYVHSNDAALLAAHRLFGSRQRVGELRMEELSEEERGRLPETDNLDIIAYQGRDGGRFGHEYFRDNPAVSSDIVVTLRYGTRPGEGLRRDLHPLDEGSTFWLIGDDYLE